MSNTDTLISSLKNKLDELRRKWSRFVFLNGLVRAVMLVLAIILILSTIEGFRYFGVSIRQNIFRFSIAFTSLFIITPLILALLIRRNRMVSYSDERLAIRIGQAFPKIADRMLNVLQLLEMAQHRHSGYSTELAEHSVKSFSKESEQYDFEKIIPWKKFRNSMIQCVSVVAVLLIFVGIWNDFYLNSFVRLTHPRQTYEVPLPFSISSLNGSFGVFGGDSVTVKILCRGDIPETIRFRSIFPDYVENVSVPVCDSNVVGIDLGAIRSTVLYEAFVENRSIFKPWKKISSGTDTIFVTDRPQILKVKTRISAPAYTGLGTVSQESNNPELLVYPGSDLQLTITANKILTDAQIRFDSGSEISLIVSGKSAQGQFKAQEADEFILVVLDENDVSNIDPMKYKLRIVPDSYPVCQLISPDADIELTEAMEIPLGIRISDDFGFSRADIRYRVLKRYASEEAIERSVEFPINNKQLTAQELYKNWSVGDLNLSPEDFIEFWTIIYDNDEINGPKSASSRIRKARFPSLNDLFSEFYEQQDDVMEEGEEIRDFLESAKDVLEEISLELLKEPQVNWEQKNQLAKEIEKTKEAGEKLSKMADQIDAMIQKSRENDLFDEETLDKYSQLQKTFQEVMTPELREAMEKLQKALEKMDNEEIRKALSQFKTSREEFSREIDRMLQLLERVKIEQSVDEIVRRLEDIVQRQENLNQEIDQTSKSEMAKLEQQANTEKAIERDTKTTFDVMERTSEDMKNFPLMPSEQLREMTDKFQKSDLMTDYKQVQSSLKSGKMEQAQNHSDSAQKQLQEFLQEMQQFQSDFNANQMNEIMNDFRDIISKTMRVSQNQERLSEVIGQTPRQSDNLMEAAVQQQQLKQNLGKVIGEIIELSNKTFGLSSSIGKSLGQASSAMNSAIQQMEERNPVVAAKSAKNATAALNRSALDLINSMNQLQQSGSASGFESYLEQLQKMAGQQQGINEDTQLFGIGESGQQAALRRLAARQQQMRKSLEQLQEEIQESGEQTGDLSGVAKDMEEVISDLQQNRILRQTLERQQRILTRLLDAQKSMRTQDYKKERKSKSGQDILRESPGQLPSDLGARQSLLQENLEKALKEGYTKETENIIRQYFELLSKENAEKK